MPKYFSVHPTGIFRVSSRASATRADHTVHTTLEYLVLAAMVTILHEEQQRGIPIIAGVFLTLLLSFVELLSP